MASLEVDEKFRRPGITSVATGVVLWFVRGLLGAIPLIGGMLSFIAFALAIILVIGGLFLLVNPRRRR